MHVLYAILSCSTALLPRNWMFCLWTHCVMFVEFVEWVSRTLTVISCWRSTLKFLFCLDRLWQFCCIVHFDTTLFTLCSLCLPFAIAFNGLGNQVMYFLTSRYSPSFSSHLKTVFLQSFLSRVKTRDVCCETTTDESSEVKRRTLRLLSQCLTWIPWDLEDWLHLYTFCRHRDSDSRIPWTTSSCDTWSEGVMRKTRLNWTQEEKLEEERQTSFQLKR
jgi:hypothetical protein